jgi:tetratricopeptide (TPR) repeat protein
MSRFGSRARWTIRPAGLFLAAGALLIFLTTAPDVRAQNEGPWRSLVVQALRAAGEHDYPKAEQTFVKAVREAESFGPNDIRLGSTLNSLGLVYRAEKKYGDAEGAYRRALAIMEAAYGDSIDVGNVGFNIAGVMFDQGHQAEALPVLRRTLAIYEKLLGDASSKTAAVLCMEGEVYRPMKHYPESEAALRQCADVREKNGGIAGNSDLADALYSLSLTLIDEGKFAAAEPRLRIAEKIREKTLGLTNPLVAQTMEDHAAVLKQLGRDTEAGKLTDIAAAIRRNQKGK